MIFKYYYESQSITIEPEIIVSFSWDCFVVVTVQSQLYTWMIIPV